MLFLGASPVSYLCIYIRGVQVANFPSRGFPSLHVQFLKHRFQEVDWFLKCHRDGAWRTCGPENGVTLPFDLLRPLVFFLDPQNRHCGHLCNSSSWENETIIPETHFEVSETHSYHMGSHGESHCRLCKSHNLFKHKCATKKIVIMVEQFGFRWTVNVGTLSLELLAMF